MNKTKSLDAEKDRISKSKSDASDLEVAQAKAIAATANENALKVSQENIKLGGQVSTDADTARSAESVLAKANKDLADKTDQVNKFAQGVAQQQQGMARQMQTTPSLNDEQVQYLASQLRAFAGQKISVHTMMDARAQRLGGQLSQAFNAAGFVATGNSTDMGPNYTGVIIAVHSASPAPHPAAADGIMNALKGIGILTTEGALDSVPEGEVWILIGPS